MPDIFPISPASARPLWFLGGVCLFLGLVIGVLAFVAYSSRHSRVEVGAENLRIVGDLWGRAVPLQALDLAHARALDLEQAPDFRPSARTFGTGLPGYASGWFRLRNGEKALAYLTQQRSVAYIPTSEGYSLLLSVNVPTGLIAALTARRH
jgi:hypothetical protein